MRGNSSNPMLTSEFPFHVLFSGMSFPTLSTPVLLVVIIPLLLPFLLRLKYILQYVFNARELLIDGVQKNGSKPFVVYSLLGPITMIPREYLPTLNHAHLSFAEYVNDAYPLTGMKDLFSRLSHIVRNNFITSVHRFSADVVDEIQFTSKLLLEDKEVTAKHTLMDFIARVDSRIIAGPELCRDKKWIHLVLRYTEHIGMMGVMLRLVPRSIARYVAVLLPGYWMSKRMAKEMEKMKGKDYEMQLLLSGSALHTTSAALTQMVFDLCCHPEIVEMLRKEVEEVGTQELPKLTKLDSFMKESQRMNPIQHATLQRKTMKEVTLAKGVVIKKNQYVMVPTTPVLRNEEIYPDPDKFDALRFYNMRKEERMANMHQFVSSSDDFFAFSRGPHTCPGRFFAGLTLKLSLVHFLMNYDLSFPNGQTQRPKNMNFEENCFPNAKQKVLFAKRKVAG